MSGTIKGFFWKDDFDNYFLGHQFEEIFKTRIYKDYLENKKDSVVIDLGGNIGLFSLYASKYAKQVYTLEPAKEHFECIQKMLEFNQITNVKAINKAIFTVNTKLPLFHNRNKTMYSLHMGVNDNSEQPEEVEAISMEQLFKDEKIEHVDLVKLDIEGSEIEVLSSLTFRSVAPKIDVVVMELHDWAGRHPNQAKDALKSNGFEVTTVLNDAHILVGVRK